MNQPWRHWITGLVAAIALSISTDVAEAASPPVTNLSLTVELNDGSRVVGMPRFSSLPVHTSFADLTLPLERLSKVAFSPTNGMLNVQLQNGDKLTGTTGLKAVEMAAVFGNVSIPLGLVQQISIRAANSGKTPALADILLYFSFDQDDGDKVIDQSPSHLDGQVSGATWVRDGKRGGAMQFDGRASRVTVPHTGQLNFGHDDFTVSFWFKVHRLNGTQQLYWHSFNPEIQLEPTGKLRAYYSWKFCGTVDSTDTVTPGEWHFVVMSRQAGTGLIYLDGKQTATVDAANCDSSSPNPLLLGYDGQMGEPLDGLLDEFIIWKRALSQDEVEELYKKDAAP